MIQIGLFSKMNQITTKTLRHYDEINLLKPAYVDDYSGYRYYSSSQLPRLHKIIALKQMGLSLDQIKRMIDEPAGIEVYLQMREQEIEDKLQQSLNQLNQIKHYQKRLRGGEFSMIYEPIIRSIPECIVASSRRIAASYDSYFDFIPKMGEEMMRQGGAKCAEPSYCFNIYHDGEYKEKDIDVEVCEAVVDYCEDSENITFKKN